MSRLFGVVRVAALVACVVSAAGCAFGTRQPTLVYPPAPVPGVSSAAQAAPRPAAKNVAIVVNAFGDQRSDKRNVGTVRNALGMRTADVVPTNGVPQWVTEAMRTELGSAGYTVASAPAPGAAPAGSVAVSGDVLNAFCDVYFSYTGQVSLLVKASRDGTVLLDRHYSGEGSAGLNVAATADSYAQSLALALADALRKFVADLDAALQGR